MDRKHKELMARALVGALTDVCARVSTRKVKAVTEELCGVSGSSHHVTSLQADRNKRSISRSHGAIIAAAHSFCRRSRRLFSPA
jgi:hypothetical protein